MLKIDVYDHPAHTHVIDSNPVTTSESTCKAASLTHHTQIATAEESARNQNLSECQRSDRHASSDEYNVTLTNATFQFKVQQVKAI